MKICVVTLCEAVNHGAFLQAYAMKKYLEEKCRVKCPYSRLRYALWHCKHGILSDVNLKYKDVKIKDVSEVWGNVYKLRPIEK